MSATELAKSTKSLLAIELGLTPRTLRLARNETHSRRC